MAFNSASSASSEASEDSGFPDSTRRLSFEGPAFNSWRSSPEREPDVPRGPLVPGFGDSTIRESQKRNDIAPRNFHEDVVLCRTCPMPTTTTHGYFLRQPRSWARFLGNRNLFEPEERRRTGPSEYESESTSPEVPSRRASSSTDEAVSLPTDSGFDDSVFVRPPNPPARVLANAANDPPEDDLLNAFEAMRVRPNI